MDLEKVVVQVVTEKLEDTLGENIQTGIEKALEDLFGNYGDLTKVIKENVKAVLLPHIESYDYSQYITKIDALMSLLLKDILPDQRKFASNLQEYFTPLENLEDIKLTDIFKEWVKYVREHIDTDDLESIDFMFSVNCNYEVEESEQPDWSSFQSARVTFECEEDENLNYEFTLSKWERKEKWDVQLVKNYNMNEFRLMNDFDIFMLKVASTYNQLVLDDTYGGEELLIEDSEF